MEKKKNSKKFLSRVLIVLGCIMIGMCFCLMGYNCMQSEKAGEKAMEDLPAVQEEIELNIRNPHKPRHVNPYDAAAVEKSKEMTVKEINGNEYIGYVEIPSYDLELPVMSDWSYPKLQIAPCRQFGSTKTNNLVVAAHNFASHFGHLKDLEAGDTIFFTDMDGEKITYHVDSVGIIPPDALDTVQNSGYDLVLYTCTYGGASRVMVGCYREQKQEPA